MNVMLLAAGQGTRLRPYTLIQPKPAIPFLTVPLAVHALSFLHGSSAPQIENLVVNTFHLPEKIKQLFNKIPHGAKKLVFSDEEGEILGGGGGLGKARHYFIGGGDFVMMNADEVILPEDPNVLKKALAHHKESNCLATLMVMEHPHVGSQFGGVWANETNNVTGFGKNPFPDTKGWHFVGVLILSEKIFDYIPAKGASNILYDSLTLAIAKGESVQVYPFECDWFETGNPQDFFKASEQCFHFLASSENSYQKNALSRTLQTFSEDPISVRSSSNYKLIQSESAVIDDKVVLEGLIVLGKNSKIDGPNQLKNVIVSSNVQVPANTNTNDVFFLTD